MRTKTIILCTAALTLSGCYSHNSMWKSSGPRYTPRAEISQNNYTQKEHQQDRMDTKRYTQYEQREPCEHYREPPRNYSDGCVSNMMKEEIAQAASPTPKPVTRKLPPQAPLLPIVHSYTVLFDFDKSDIRGNEMSTLDKIAREINQYHPKQVTVTGYTDSRGTVDYNQTLSHEREQAVSNALMKRGIQNQTLDREARGEYEQAVKTADGIKNQQNRRVVIDFRR